MNEIQVGQLLDGRFKILNVVTRSGMSSIYEAVDCSTGNSVAIKVPFMQFESDPAHYSRFLREEEVGRVLQHPCILKVIPVGEKSRPYIAMEFVKGRTLAQLLRCIRPLPIPDALHIARTICDALVYMHRADINVVHRDLKPDNIMIGGDGKIRVMDFGIAKADWRAITLGFASAVKGTPHYMSPEQVLGRATDTRTDIYGLGAVLYEMTTGFPPFRGDNIYSVMNARIVGDPVAPSILNPEISPQVEEIILHCLARNPADRYQSAAELKHDLEEPDGVKVTGRRLRLRVPNFWRIWLQILKPILIGVLTPILIFASLYCRFRK